MKAEGEIQVNWVMGCSVSGARIQTWWRDSSKRMGHGIRKPVAE